MPSSLNISKAFAIWPKYWILFLILTTSCKTTKKVLPNEELLIKQKIELNGKTKDQSQLKELLTQNTNSKILGIPLRLHLYNLSSSDIQGNYERWLNKKPNRSDRLKRLLSQKQFERLSESFFVSGIHQFLQNVGEEPVLVDSSAIKTNVNRLKLYHKNRGYFNVNIRYDKNTKGKQKSQITYKIDTGEQYIIEDFDTNIASNVINQIYSKEDDSTSVVQIGSPFLVKNFSDERKRLTALFRNKGVYNFQESSISFDILGDTTAVASDAKPRVKVLLNIDNPRGISNEEYSSYTIGDINVYTDFQPAAENQNYASLEQEGSNFFYIEKMKYKPELLSPFIFLRKGEVYQEMNRTLTSRQLSSLNIFSYPSIEFIPNEETKELNTNIYLRPKSKYALSLDFDITHSNIRPISTAFSSSILSRNVFGQMANLGLSIRGSVGVLGDSGPTQTNTSEFGADINLTFPRFWIPFTKKSLVSSEKLPKTLFSIGTNFQNNIGLDRQRFNTIFSYNWQKGTNRKNFELAKIEYVRNLNPANFFRVYANTFEALDQIANQIEDQSQYQNLFETQGNQQVLTIPSGANLFIEGVQNNDIVIDEKAVQEVNRIEERRSRLTENNLIVSTAYTFISAINGTTSSDDFRQFRFKLEAAGNLLNNFSINKADVRQRLFGVAYSQYIKGELDYIKHFRFAENKHLAFRFFGGIAVPLGNAQNIPFVRSYFAGGSNDNRAWNAYGLGPGTTQSTNEFNEANFKLNLNVEYRFPLFANLRGALFVDAGNIWNVLDNQQNESAIFKGFSSLRDTAIGSGLGLRFDFSYFIFRFDTGFKTYNPVRPPSERWFRDLTWKEAVFNIGINYPF